MRIGVLGGGQLGRMTALAGIPLGLEFRFWDPSPHSTAGSTGELVCGEYDDEAALVRFADGLDIITYEFENVPAATLNRLSESGIIRPGRRALEISQDRVFEKQFFAETGVPTGEWRSVESLNDVVAAFADFGESILKTRRFGYDGKGQFRVSVKDDCEKAWQALGAQPLIAEKLIPFDRELSLVGVRGADGDVRTWPLVENIHVDGILHRTTAPASVENQSLQNAADAMLWSLLEAFDYVGVLTIELFEMNGQLLANEMAPRVHNSGHWTIEGSVTSQFENHLRAVCGLPLGSVSLNSPSVMLNCIGAMPPAGEVLKIPGAHLHDYGKSPRNGRKVGHITVCRELSGEPNLEENVAAIETLIRRTQALATQ